MPDSQTLINLGAFGVVLFGVGMFFTRMVWPFIVKRVEMNDQVVTSLQGEVARARAEFLAALAQHDEKLAGALKEVSSDLVTTLQERDQRLAAELVERDGELAKAIRELRAAIRPPAAPR